MYWICVGRCTLKVIELAIRGIAYGSEATVVLVHALYEGASGRPYAEARQGPSHRAYAGVAAQG